MAPPAVAQFLPGHRHGPSRSLLFLLLGGLTFLTLCLFTSHLPALQQLTSVSPFGASAGKSRMTSTGAAAPHHQGPSQDQVVLLDLIEHEKEKKLENVKMEYGTNKHPPFKDDPPLLVGDLPQEHIPSSSPASPTKGPDGENRTNGKRLVVVGDVHGQRAALKALLRKIGFDHKHGDHLVLAGDMVTKGPDSKGVVKLAMDIGASAVRGNQEDKVLAAAREIHRFSVDDDSRLGPEADGDGEGGAGKGDDDNGEAETEARRKDHARSVARSLSRAQLAWLRSLPIILRIGHLPDATSAPWNASTLAVVHAGLVPGVPLKKQDPWAVMNMRSLVYPRKGKGKKNKGKPHSRSNSPSDDTTPEEATTELDALTLAPDADAVAVPIDGRDGEPWSHAWNRHQNTLPPSTPHTLAIYGHDAKAGLQVTPKVDISPYYYTPSSSPSIRTIHGKQLTALVIEARSSSEGGGGVRHRIEQVDCADPEVRGMEDEEEEGEGEIASVRLMPEPS
ncbi:Metallo-dependent phosphatase-like protein [Parachaetomium inaequale]|uniref:Metallo-dependent phosphatase-like protein n=1 Tax=Parachaetomium inaequale TaxID=2588326 RepID=A0AAN6PJH6_9PEZI|nr:Metallo-dependent phosphatase-like protein [Parachaetomium inaequale]